jgi:hypothetical protein
VLNTAITLRFNGTMRQSLASLTHKCRQAAGGTGKRDVAAWLYIQLLLAPSRVEPACRQGSRKSGRTIAYEISGQWLDRSCLEHPGTLELPRRSLVLD